MERGVVNRHQNLIQAPHHQPSAARLVLAGQSQIEPR